MPDFNLPLAITLTLSAYALSLYALTLAAILAWLFASKQESLPRTVSNSLCIALRLAIVFAVIFCFGWFVKLAFWLVIVFLLGFVVVNAIAEVPIVEFVGRALIYIAQQFVLGFPDKSEWVLSPTTEPTVPDTSVDLRSELISQSGITLSPLRPMGEVQIDGVGYRAKSIGGEMLGIGEEIIVTSVHQGTLVVQARGGDDVSGAELAR